MLAPFNELYEYTGRTQTAAMMIFAATASSFPLKASFDKGYVDKIG